MKKTRKSKRTKEERIEQLKKVSKGTQFTSENQPSPEAKSNGKRKKRILRDLANAVVTGERLERAREIAEALGLDLEDDEFTFDIVLTMRQAEKALAKGDTSAYNAVMDRLIGKPKQAVDLTSGGDKINIPSKVIYKNI